MEDAVLYLVCPHCEGAVEVAVAQINCAIFRHGSFKETGQPMNPHASEIECDAATASGAIHGCGKPFRLVQQDGAWTAEVCEYI